MCRKTEIKLDVYNARLIPKLPMELEILVLDNK